MENDNKELSVIDIDNQLEELVDVLVSDIQEGDQSEMESFESYQHRVKQEMIDDMQDFKDKFLSGYEVILE